MLARGAESLTEHAVVESFDGEIDATNTYILDEDYAEGDIVTVINEYGIRKDVRITAIMESWDAAGYAVVPVYENVEV